MAFYTVHLVVRRDGDGELAVVHVGENRAAAREAFKTLNLPGEYGLLENVRFSAKRRVVADPTMAPGSPPKRRSSVKSS